MRKKWLLSMALLLLALAGCAAPAADTAQPAPAGDGPLVTVFRNES